jgi:predicted lipid-binding transport protein (Tim44 family)
MKLPALQRHNTSRNLYDWPKHFLYKGLSSKRATKAQRESNVVMSPVFDPLNIILLAVAVIMLWRLKSVLGQRTGNERPPLDTTVFKPKQQQQAETPLPTAEADSSATESNIPVWAGYAVEGSPLAKDLEAIAASDTTFKLHPFVEGAKRAYEMVLEAFAKGDKAKLKSLLGKEVFESFAEAIDTRAKDGSNIVFQFVGVSKTEIDRASLEGKRASITLKFRSDMIHALVSKDGETLEGDAKTIRDVEDIWTFERDVSARDPNWKLVSTDDEIG